MYKSPAQIMDRGPMPRRPAAATLHPMAGAPRPPRSARSPAGGDPLLGEVRWRLFRQEDLPARLRRLQRLEEVAESELRGDGAPAKPEPQGR